MILEEKISSKIFSSNYRIIYEGAIYHVIQRAPGKDVLFLEDKDFLYFVHILKEIKDKFSLNIFCFCLMPNHLHILLKINKTNLSEAMKSLFARYAMYFNEKYKRKGHVFYGKYRASLCLDDRYLITASVYIHLNPYKAGLVSNPENYRWSSLQAYFNLPSQTFLDYQYVLKVVSEDISKASYSYRKILEKAEGLGFKNIIEDYRFIKTFSLKLFRKINLLTKFMKEDVIDGYLCKFNDKKRLRTPEELSARKYLVEQLKSRGYTIKEIAQILNLSRQTIHTIMA
jgi:putative transposase